MRNVGRYEIWGDVLIFYCNTISGEYEIWEDTRSGVSYDMCVDMRMPFDTKCGVIPSIERYEIWGYKSYGKIRNVV